MLGQSMYLFLSSLIFTSLLGGAIPRRSTTSLLCAITNWGRAQYEGNTSKQSQEGSEKCSRCEAFQDPCAQMLNPSRVGVNDVSSSVELVGV